MSNRCELILALDVSDRDQALKSLKPFNGEVEWIKIGLTLFCRYGPELVQRVADMGFRIFLDLKLYDIPHQVEGAIRNLCRLPIDLLTIHASGGGPMLQAAAHARIEAGGRARLLGVTVLTSFDQQSLAETGIHQPIEKQVELLAGLGVQSGLDGLVCSPLELDALRARLGPDVLLVTPGIRPVGSDAGDQKRILTPSEAAQKGASFIVVGRPILQADNPPEAAAAIRAELT
jgi:orotidine-5'-phosphate decarboxylase